MIESSTPAITSEYSAGCCAPWLSIVYSPIVSGNVSPSESMMYGSRKLFQIATNCSRKTVTSPGTIIGSAIERNSRSSPAPSIRPASSVSVGHRGRRVDAAEVDAERADDAGQQHRPVRAGEPRLRQQQVLRDGEDDLRHQHAGEQDVEQRARGRGSGTWPARSRPARRRPPTAPSRRRRRSTLLSPQRQKRPPS